VRGAVRRLREDVDLVRRRALPAQHDLAARHAALAQQEDDLVLVLAARHAQRGEMRAQRMLEVLRPLAEHAVDGMVLLEADRDRHAGHYA